MSRNHCLLEISPHTFFIFHSFREVKDCFSSYLRATTACSCGSEGASNEGPLVLAWSLPSQDLKMCLMQAIEHNFRLLLMCVAVLSYLLSTRNLFPQSVCCYMVFAMVSERNIYFPERVRLSVSRIAAGSVAVPQTPTCLRPGPLERVYNIRKATTR